MSGLPMNVAILTGLIALVSPTPSPAELIAFANGGEVQLPAEIEGDVVRLLGPQGQLTFHRDDFRAIVPGHWPERDWLERRARALKGTASDRYRAAWWALEHGLTSEAIAMLRASHKEAPHAQPVARLVSVLDRLEQPARSPDLGPLRGAIGGEFSVAEGNFVVLLHQHEAPEAAARVALLDRVLTTFYLNFEALGFRLQVPAEKLVSVWFAEEADYRAFIRREAGPAFLTTRGYYHPGRRVVFTYDGRSRVRYRRATEAMEQRRRSLDQASHALTDTPPLGRLRLELPRERPRMLGKDEAAETIERLRRDLDREALLLELDRIQVDEGAAVHELIHQVVLASGLAPAYDRFPIWLHEGLAMQFEGFRGGRWAGVGSVLQHRLDHWRTLPRPPDLRALLRDVGFGRGYQSNQYAAAWALVFHLRKRHPEQFVAFLDRLRNPGPSGSDRVESAFRASFGPDLEAVRREWITDLQTLRSALENGLDEPDRHVGQAGFPPQEGWESSTSPEARHRRHLARRQVMR